MSPKKRCLVLLIILSVAITVIAQSTGQDVSHSQVDSIFNDFQKTSSPGCALAVIKDGQIVYQRGYGFADLDHEVRITPDSVFYLASDSKQFTAFAVALLVEQGRIALDDRITKYFPELTGSIYGDVTVGHLIYHTSGIRDYWPLRKLAGHRDEEPFTQADFLSLMAKQKALNFRPGDEYMYSNSGYVLLAILVERVTGKTLAGFTRENIFAPLGMKHSQFIPDHSVVVPGLATGYSYRDGQIRTDRTTVEPSGDGGLVTSVLDLALWDENFHRNKLGKASPELIKLVEAPGTLNSGKKSTYAFGLALLDYKGFKTITHSGSFAGFKSYMVRFPEQRFSVMCLCNSDAPNVAPWDLSKKVADIYLTDKTTSTDILEKPNQELSNTQKQDTAITLNQEQLARYQGTFRETDGTIWKLTAVVGQLVASVQGIKFQLVPLSPTHFKATGAPQPVDIYFPSDDLKERTVELQVGHQPRSVLTLVSVVKPADLSSYVGKYYSHEVDATYETFVKKDGLYVNRKLNPQEALEPLGPDEFKMGNETIHFERNASHAISGFGVDSEGVKDIHFSRIICDAAKN
jgi:CubicO group peptidase (beta-lactamase class C family)